MSIDVARPNPHHYDQSPFAMTFTSNDNSTEAAHTTETTYETAYDPNDCIKRHAACDECRNRKLKCSGEPAGCARCVKQKLVCHYSEQKQMGRPRKRQKADDGGPTSNRHAASPVIPIQPAPRSIRQTSFDPNIVDPSLSLINTERSQSENICNGPMAATVRMQRMANSQDSSTPALRSGNSDISHSQIEAFTPDNVAPFATSYPTDVAQWPDFSTLDMLPLPVEHDYPGVQPISLANPDPDANPEVLNNLPSVPACPCLPNLYLTLSTMSTLSSFPFTPQTVATIEAGYRTARGVIYCVVCPQRFDTGSSNLMLGCTLLNVLADQWQRFRKLSVEDLRKAFGTPDQHQGFPTTREGLEWRTFAHRTIRAYVFGDHAIPSVPGLAVARPPSTSLVGTTSAEEAAGTNKPALTLMELCDALTRRQRQWHGLDEPTDEFPDRVTPDLTGGHMVGQSHDQPGKHLCLEIVTHSRCIVSSLDGPMRH